VSAVTRRRLLRQGASGAALVAGGGLLAACGGDDRVAPGRAASAIRSGDPRPGGTLRVAVATTPADALDPRRTNDILGVTRLRNCCDTLLLRDARGRLAPALAEEVEPNADGTRWSIRLRDGVTFQDGRPLRAHDVLWTVREIRRAPQLGAQFRAVDAQRSRVRDRRTVELVLSRPVGDLDDTLADAYLFVLPEGTGAIRRARDLVGTGPYRLVEAEPGRRSLLEANPEHWGGRPVADRLELIGVPEPGGRATALRAGQVDVALDIGPREAARRRGDAGVQLRLSRTKATLGWLLNLRRPPFDDPRVREAFKLAIDRRTLVETVLAGFGEPGNDVWGASFDGFNADLEPRPHDPKRARALLREAGVQRLRTTLKASDYSAGLLEATTLFREQLKTIGVDLRVDAVAPDRYLAQVPDLLRAPGWAFTFNQKWSLFAEVVYLEGAPFNMGFDDAAWQRRFLQARAIVDRDRRHAAFAELQEQLYRDGGDLCWGLAPTITAAGDAVRGLDRFEGSEALAPRLAKVGLA
jgi:peptide/nickel transport system substrate-binding protein